MTWLNLGSLIPSEDWVIIPNIIAQELNLFRINFFSSYENPNDGYGWLRFYYPNQGAFSEKWERFYPKNSGSELLIFNPIPLEKQIAVKKTLYQYYGDKRVDLQWSIQLEVWDESITQIIDSTQIIQAIENIPITINQTIENNTVLAQSIAQEVMRQNQLTNQQVVTEILTFFTGGV